ncbi:MAG: phosphate ABC transporter ATP-binding protein [Parvularcula sp.]
MTSSSRLKIVSDEHHTRQQAVVVDQFNAWFKNVHILNDVSATFAAGEITCIVGPSGSGKSTLLRSINRINDEVPGFDTDGAIIFDGKNVYTDFPDLTFLRRDIGMVFQKPCVFPKSIAENVLFGVKAIKKLKKQERLLLLEETLKAVSLWKEVSHRLNDSATTLSGGQQQRLCIARTLAVKPKILLLDEPTASIDPISGRSIEELLVTLKKDYTILFVTHDLQQMKRIADHIVFMCEGQIIEQGPREQMLTAPKESKTANYLTGDICEC